MFEPRLHDVRHVGHGHRPLATSSLTSVPRNSGAGRLAVFGSEPAEGTNVTGTPAPRSVLTTEAGAR